MLRCNFLYRHTFNFIFLWLQTCSVFKISSKLQDGRISFSRVFLCFVCMSVHTCVYTCKIYIFNRLSINNLFLHMLLDRHLTFFLITNKSFQCSLLNSSACLLLWNTFLSWFESCPYYRQNSYVYLCLFLGFLIFFLELCFSILIIVTSYFVFLPIGENHRRNR